MIKYIVIALYTYCVIFQHYNTIQYHMILPDIKLESKYMKQNN